MCVFEGWRKDKGGSGSYLGGLVRGSQQKLKLLCVLTPDVSILHFMLLSLVSSRVSAAAKMQQKTH